MKEEINNSK